MKLYVVRRKMCDEEAIMGIFDSEVLADRLLEELRFEELQDHVKWCTKRGIDPGKKGYATEYSDGVEEFKLNKRMG